MGKIPILTNIFQMGWNHQLVHVSWLWKATHSTSDVGSGMYIAIVAYHQTAPEIIPKADMDEQTLQETATLQARDENDAGWCCVVHLTVFVLYVFVWRCLRLRCEVLELKNNMLLYIFR